MNRKFIPCLAAAVALSAASTYAGVTFSQVAADDNTPWAASFGGGTLAASLVATSLNSSVAEGVTGAGNNFFGQSFKGNDQEIQGWGFFGNGGNGVALSYTITLLDYGTIGPIDTGSEFLGASTTLVSTTFDLGGSGSKRQMLFDFTGGDTVSISSTHYYAIYITAPATSSTFLHRLGGGASTYADGTGVLGANTLGTGSFGGNTRDTIFALYTATAVPEPSTYAVIVGAVVGAAACLRRRRR